MKAQKVVEEGRLAGGSEGSGEGLAELMTQPL